ncbi:non-ribosomal peptide synthetase [Dactylosporangium sp. CA-139066]|uniref:non-ribosomal peptide synthetase n=1 Tax=Dactylosporangium sp. CA-139066 TaxID=3239930 RepID=UPI003D8DD0A4
MNQQPRSRRAAARGSIADLIWQRAADTPDAVAVIDGTGAATTYRELTRQADTIAGELAAAGADEVVGVCWPRSVDGLVRFLGVWRAGAAVLYLDPDWPVARLQYMAAACAVRQILQPEPTLHLPAPQSVAVLPPPVTGALCYVVFTSGSTGIPKGVLIEQPGVTAMATALAERLDVIAGTRVLQFAAWSWDAAMAEILMTLTAGATLVLAPAMTRHGGPALAGLLREHRVDVVTLTPSVLAATPADDLPDLRTVVAVGEPVHPHLVTRWAGPNRQLLNGYGPTEATVAVTIAELHPGEEVHIGTPLPGVTVRIVDEHGRPRPAGATGEILVGGLGVARGYTGSPAATEARFSTDKAGHRWYHTGDLAAWRPDGTLTYLGRTDDQIKLRGHRLTLGEVEHVVAAHPAVRGCAVVAVADRLTAFVVADPDHDTGLAETDLAAAVRGHAAALLPPFATPHVRLVTALPLTAGGKTDHETLRAHAADQDPTSDRHSADGSLPVTLAVVAAVLDQPVHADTDVIDAGGHSLLVAQLSVALSEALGVEVPYVTVALNRTPAGIAAAIDNLTRHAAGNAA